MRATTVWGLAGALAALALSGAPAVSQQLPQAAPDSARLDSAATAAAPFELEGPKAVLGGLPFEVTVRRTAGDGRGGAPLPFRLVTASGRTLATGSLAAGSDTTIGELAVEGAGELPIRLVAGDDGEAGAGAAAASASPTFLPGWISVLPPLIAIALALIFREVVTSLFVGVWLGAFFWVGMNPLQATWRTVDRFVVPALADPDHAAIIVFSLLLGGMVGVMARSGGTRGIVDAVEPLATSPRRAQLAAYLAGIAIFFDDYANTLIVGNTFRPITDRMKVSREKLAYIVDSTAAPIASIVFVSTWVGFEISLIAEGLEIAATQPGVSSELAAGLRGASPFLVFMHSIPFRFYPLLALILVGLIIWTQRDFGPMWKAENRASRGEGLYREGAQLMADTSGGAMDAKKGAPRRWYNAALPVLTVVAVVLFGLYFDGRAAAGAGASLWTVFGEADPFAALLWGSLAGLVLAVALSVGQRILSVQEAVDATLGGMRSMMLAMVILVLAWALSEMTRVLGTAPFLAGILSEQLPLFLLPAVVFVTAAATAFATGTSWGTMAILLPIVIPLTATLGGGTGFEGGGYTILLGTISSVLAGAIFGDHCSPISDTTVLSSMASACDHVDHVRTQLPYALTAAVVGIAVGDVPTALGLSPWISIAAGAVILFLVLRFLGARDDASPQWEGRGV